MGTRFKARVGILSPLPLYVISADSYSLLKSLCGELIAPPACAIRFKTLQQFGQNSPNSKEELNAPPCCPPTRKTEWAVLRRHSVRPPIPRYGLPATALRRCPAVRGGRSTTGSLLRGAHKRRPPPPPPRAPWRARL